MRQKKSGKGKKSSFKQNYKKLKGYPESYVRVVKVACFFLLLFAFGVMGVSYTWIFGSYGRRDVVSNPSGVSLLDFPYLLNGSTYYVNTNSLISAGKMQSDCDDIRPLNNSMNTQLSFEFGANTSDATYGCNAPKTEIWIRSNLTSGTNTNYLFYGNSTSTAGNNSEAVWNSSFKAVYHFDECPASNCVNMTYDSTSNNNDIDIDMLASAYAPIRNSTGKFGYSMNFTTPQYLRIPNSGSTRLGNIGDSYTVEMWVYPMFTGATSQRLYIKGATGMSISIVSNKFYCQLWDGISSPSVTTTWVITNSLNR